MFCVVVRRVSGVRVCGGMFRKKHRISLQSESAAPHRDSMIIQMICTYLYDFYFFINSNKKCNKKFEDYVGDVTAKRYCGQGWRSHLS